MDREGRLGFTLFETGARIGTLNFMLGDQLLAKVDADLLDRRLCVVFLGHAIDLHLAGLLTVDEMHDENLFVARSHALLP